jgi:general secretion pathway protein D
LVINQILGDFLHLDYTVAPDVSGTVTMRVSDLRSRAQALDALRAGLSPLGAALVERGDVVAVVRGSGERFAGTVAVLAPGEPAPAGAALAVVTPRYIAPTTLQTLIAPFAPQGTVGLADDGRRLIVLRGEEASITAASQAIALFDVDWFKQISTGVFPLTNVSPEELAGELKPLLGPAADQVELVPVPRLQSLVVLARSPDALHTVKSWVERLDVTAERMTGGLLIYDARYSDAGTLASAVASLMGAAGGSAAAPSEERRASDLLPSSSFQGGFTPGGGSGLPTSLQPGGLSPGAFQSSGLSGQGRSTFSAGRFHDSDASRGATGGAGVAFNGGQSAGAPGLVVTADRDQNAVIARGDEAQIAEARSLLKALDRPRAQVLIEATIAEVTLTDDLKYGVNWSAGNSTLKGVFSDAANGAVASSFPGLSISYVNMDVSATLSLLSSLTKVEVVSRPSVIALNNEPAMLQVGDQVPIITTTAISVLEQNAPIVNQTTYRDTGVILSVIPHVRAGGLVDIEVAQEVSDVAPTTSSTINSPTISQRRIESRLVVPSGGSVALGGLISSKHTKGTTGVPVLKSVPVVGRLFRTETTTGDRTELIVFLTPRVLATPNEAVDTSSQMRAAMGKLEALLATP